MTNKNFALKRKFYNNFLNKKRAYTVAPIVV